VSSSRRWWLLCSPRIFLVPLIHLAYRRTSTAKIGFMDERSSAGRDDTRQTDSMDAT